MEDENIYFIWKENHKHCVQYRELFNSKPVKVKQPVVIHTTN